MLNCFSEIRLARFYHAVQFFGILLLCTCSVAHADGVDEVGKLFKQGQHGQALDKVNKYLAGKPKDAQARFLKGLILNEQGKSADAIQIFSALTEDYPDLPEPYNNLAVLYANQGQYDKAKQLLEKAINTHPSYATAHENLGDIYAKMASQAYDRALQLDHGNSAATQTKLAMIQNLHNLGARGPATSAHDATVPDQTCVEPCLGDAESSPAIAAENQHAEPAQLSPVATATPVETTPLAPLSANTGDMDKDVVATVTAWAAAWSAKKVDKYLSFYAADFKTPGGETRAAWAKARKERISKPKHIHEIGRAHV